MRRWLARRKVKKGPQREDLGKKGDGPEEGVSAPR